MMTLTDQLQVHTDTLADLQRQRAELAANGGGAQVAKQLAEVEAEITRYESAKRREWSATLDNEGAEYMSRKRAVVSAKAAVDALKHTIANGEADLIAVTTRGKTLKASLTALMAVRWSDDDAACGMCRQPLPDDQREALRAKFNTEHAANKAKAEAAMEKALAEHKRINGALHADREKLAQAECALTLAEADLGEPPSTAPFVMDIDDEGYGVLLEEKGRLMLLATKAGPVDTADLDAKIAETQAAITAATEAAAKQNLKAENEKRIVELEAKLKKLGADHEIEKFNVLLCDEFEVAKVRMTSEVINGKFDLTRFRMFVQQVNGEIAECCDLLYDGRTWPNMSTSERINVGLDCINSLCNGLGHAEDAPFVIVDFCESVDEPRPTIGQQWRLRNVREEKVLQWRTVKGANDAKQETLAL